jgi:hypothetical protein
MFVSMACCWENIFYMLAGVFKFHVLLVRKDESCIVSGSFDYVSLQLYHLIPALSIILRILVVHLHIWLVKTKLCLEFSCVKSYTSKLWYPFTCLKYYFNNCVLFWSSTKFCFQELETYSHLFASYPKTRLILMWWNNIGFRRWISW